MSYKYDTFDYKGFRISIINDENPEEPDWAEEEVFIEKAGNHGRWSMGREPAHTPSDYLDWGEGPWGEYNDLLRREGVEVPPDEWEDDEDEWEKRAAWELYDDWKESNSDKYIVWPLRGGNAHGPGTFTLWVVDLDERDYDQVEFWIFVKADKTDLERLAEVNQPADRVEPRAVRDRCIALYEQWAQGDIWGFVIQDSDGEQLDSCWGYYGTDDCISQAKESADGLVGETESHRFAAHYDDNTWEWVDVEVPVEIGAGGAARWALDTNQLDREPMSLVHTSDLNSPTVGGEE